MAERCSGFGDAGRPDRAATTESWATARAGRREARTAVPMASTIEVAINHHGRSRRRAVVGARREPRGVGDPGTEADCGPDERTHSTHDGPVGNHDGPDVAIRRTSDESIPRARSRRCASKVKPATATRPMKVSPTMAKRNSGSCQASHA